MLRYEKSPETMVEIVDLLFIFREFIPGLNPGGNTVLYRLMEYHLDPELER